MDGLNPFAELQQYQLGSSLMGQPPVPTPAVQPAQAQLPMGGMPAAAAGAPQQDPVSGWRSALGELSANPVAAIMLLQMGTTLGAGRGFNTALSESLGAAGRAGGIQNKFAEQKLREEMLGRESGRQDRQMELNEARLGLEERRVDAAERAMEARLARTGGGSGGGGGGGGSKTDPAAALKRWEMIKAWRMTVNGNDEAEASEFADYSTFGASRIPKPDASMTPSLWMQEAQHWDKEEADAAFMGDKERAARAKQEAAAARANARGQPAATAPSAGASRPDTPDEAKMRAAVAKGFTMDEILDQVRRDRIQVGNILPLAGGGFSTITPERLAELKRLAGGGGF